MKGQRYRRGRRQPKSGVVNVWGSVPEELKPFLTPGGLLKKQVRTVTGYNYLDISPALLNLQMESAAKAGTMSGAISIGMGVYDTLQAWISSYARAGSKGWSDFQWHWKCCRNIVGLQVRLLTEQILWDMGSPWNSLNTGFKAVGEKTRGNASPPTQSGPGITQLASQSEQVGGPSQAQAAVNEMLWRRKALNP